MKRTIFLVVVVVLAIMAWVGYRMFDERTPTAAEKSADVSVSATDLFNAFTTDEVAAGGLYNDKVIEVSGTVRSVDAPANGPVNVLLETGDPLGAVVCEFAPDAAPNAQSGQDIRIKGFCAGFNLDVLLQRCATVER